MAALVVVLVVVGGVTLAGLVVAKSGASSPIAAVQGVFNGTGEYADADGSKVLRYLCPERAEELRSRVVTIRADLVKQKDTALTVSRFVELPMDGGVRVSVQVAAVTTVRSGSQTVFAHGEEHEWRFETVGSGDDWRVCGWAAPDLCDVYVNCD